MLAAVTVNLECAHCDKAGRLHGHSYLVEVWFHAGPDLDMVNAAVGEMAKLVDHTRLEKSIGSSGMEGVAAWFISRCGLIDNGGMNLAKVIVRRPTLGYIVEALPN